MATVTKTIGSGGDYATIADWNNDLDNSSVYSTGDIAVGEIISDQTGSFTINGGHTIDLASRVLTVGAAFRHTGIAGSGVKLTGGLLVAHGGTDYIPMEISWLEIVGGGTIGSGVRVANFGGGSGLCNIHHCIIHDISEASTGVIAGIAYTGFGHGTVHNCVIYNIDKQNSAFSRIAYGIWQGTSGLTKNAYNNTIYNISNSDTDAENSFGILNEESAGEVKNNIVITVTAVGGTATDYGGSATFAANGSEDSSGQITGLSAANLFVSTTPGSEDLRLKAGAAAIDAGENLGADFAVDIAGTTRSGTWDIGAHEFFPSGGPWPFHLDAQSLAGGLQTLGL